ncbi:MAG TPA: 5-(carboxyamino)imidazole ribonucleotide synthase, partial [Bacteroidota bacterium]
MTLLPPATIGIIGGGQLGMMTLREAHRMGFRSVVWDPDPECPSSRLADNLITAPFSDPTAARRLSEQADVVTYEFENIDPSAVAAIEASKPVFPGAGILKVAQNREAEKSALVKGGFPVAPHAVARNRKDLEDAVLRLGFPVVVKTTTAGYDGKGQSVLRSASDLDSYCDPRSEVFSECVVEKFLPLQVEVSVIAVRSGKGDIVTFPVLANEHRENILHVTRVPARVSAGIADEAIRLATSIIDHFAIVGVLCVEMFVTTDEKVVVNELAPRPHNSGHFSLDACSFSQFEALVRTVCGLPVQRPRLLTPCGMVNVLGKHLERMDFLKVQEIPGSKIHLYGKKRLEPKRKMGHVTVVGSTWEEVEERIQLIERLIGETGKEGHIG